MSWSGDIHHNRDCKFLQLPGTPGVTQRPGGLALTERLLVHCSLPEQALIVDIGCGSAATVRFLSATCNYRVVGIDASVRSLKMVNRQEGQPALACGLGHFLPFPGGRVDAVVIECSASIMGDFQALFKEFSRILKPGGYLLVSDLYTRDSHGTQTLRDLKGECYLKHISMQAEIAEVLKQNGFEIRLWEDHSDQLKGYTLQWAMTFCSLGGSKLPQKDSASQPDALDLHLAVSKARLGYYLLVAEKV